MPECELLSYFTPSPLLYLFSAFKALFCKLCSFYAKVLFVFYSFIFVLLTHIQPPLSISSDDQIHHKLIGRFQLSASANSDIKIGICYTAAGVSWTAKVKRPLYLKEVNQLALKVDRDRALCCRSV